MRRLWAGVLAALLTEMPAMPAAAIGLRDVEEGAAYVPRAVSAPTAISHENAWEQLLPRDEREHFSMIPPPPLHDYLSGDVMPSRSGSSAVNTALEGATVRLPGFIVPLELTLAGLVSEFLLVPYAGACIHVPPPPPNQRVHVTLGSALPLHVLYEPYWVSGTLRTPSSASPSGAAAYLMKAIRVEPYNG